MVYQWYTITPEATMIKSLVKHGNSWALVIDRPILDLLHIDPTSEVELTTDGHSITVSPLKIGSRKSAVRTARKKINARYGKVFKKLAE
jgi:antitoxin component of MazEF toxin-antitoxin module